MKNLIRLTYFILFVLILHKIVTNNVSNNNKNLNLNKIEERLQTKLGNQAKSNNSNQGKISLNLENKTKTINNLKVRLEAREKSSSLLNSNLNYKHKLSSKSNFKTQSKSKSKIRANNNVKTNIELSSNFNSNSKLSTGFTHKAKNSLRTKYKSGLQMKGQLSTNEDNKPKLPDGFVSWFEGWVHYYKYNNDTIITRPREFYINKKYWKQRKDKSELTKEDQFGRMIIPDKNSFYLVLGVDSFHLYSSRDDPFLGQMDHLNYGYIEPIPTDKKYEGGVQDMFRFSIGYCLMVKAQMALEGSSEFYPQRWIFCVNTEKEKNKLLNALIKAKLYVQSLKGEIVSSDGLNSKKSAEDISNYLSTKRRDNKEEDLKKSATAVDGYWITLQDWTSCSLKCGGGLSFKQKMCVPPKNGGRECSGEALEKRECNTQPCPEVKNFLKQQEETKPVYKSPIVKIGSFSQRPQRYIKCIIKEVDAFADITGPDNLKQKYPVRVVMNEKTISIKKSDNYQDVVDSFDLSETNFTVGSTFCCFQIADKLKSKNICGFEDDCGSAEKNEWVKKWENDFKLFKDQCYAGTEESLLDGDDEKLLNNKAQNKLKQVNLEIAKAKQVRIKEELVNEQTEQLRGNLEKTQQTGFQAIEKELDIENMLKEEEKQKEVEDINRLSDKLSVETEKLKCVKESFQEKEIDNEFVATQHQLQSDISQIKQEFSEKILQKRQNLKNILEKMRKKSKMSKSKLEGEIKTLRNKINAEFTIANKNGNIETCREAKLDKDKREKYCNLNFVDDFVSNSDCKQDGEFCYLCCETEFGNSYMDKREKCYSMCDIKEDPISPPPGNRWQWKQ